MAAASLAQLLDLPPDLLARIGALLPFEERLQLSLVCRRWREVCAGPSELWRSVDATIRHGSPLAIIPELFQPSIGEYVRSALIRRSALCRLAATPGTDPPAPRLTRAHPPPTTAGSRSGQQAWRSCGWRFHSLPENFLRWQSRSSHSPFRPACCTAARAPRRRCPCAKLPLPAMPRPGSALARGAYRMRAGCPRCKRWGSGAFACLARRGCRVGHAGNFLHRSTPSP